MTENRLLPVRMPDRALAGGFLSAQTVWLIRRRPTVPRWDDDVQPRMLLYMTPWFDSPWPRLFFAAVVA